MNGYFLCYKTHFSQTFRIFATLIREKTIKDVQPLSETRKAKKEDDYEKECK